LRNREEITLSRKSGWPHGKEWALSQGQLGWYSDSSLMKEG